MDVENPQGVQSGTLGVTAPKLVLSRPTSWRHNAYKFIHKFLHGILEKVPAASSQGNTAKRSGMMSCCQGKSWMRLKAVLRASGFAEATRAEFFF